MLTRARALKTTLCVMAAALRMAVIDLFFTLLRNVPAFQVFVECRVQFWRPPTVLKEPICEYVFLLAAE
jgi:hypothetical protein